MPPAAQSTLDRLDDARQRWWFFSFLCGLFLAVAVSIAALLVAVQADVLLQLPLGGLRVLLVVWIGATAAFVGRTVYRSIKHPRNIEAAARRVELSFPEAGSHLINLIQLTSLADGAADGFRQSAIAEAAANVSGLPFHDAANRHTRWERWRLGLQTPRDLAEATTALGLMLGLAVLLAVAVPKWSSSLERLCTPWRFVPQVGAIEILEITPGDTEILLGSPLAVAAKIAVPANREDAVKAVLLITADGGKETTRPMLSGTDGDSFTASLSSVTGPLQYRLQIGDSQSDVYHVKIAKKPIVEDVEATYEYPAYLNKQNKTLRQQHADLEAPQYTTAHLKFTCSTAIVRGHIELPSSGKVIGSIGKDGRTLAIDLMLAKPTSYTIHLYDKSDNTNLEPRVNTIRVIPDAPPTVQIVKPTGETSVAAGTAVPLVVRANDDYGLSEVRLEWKLAEQENTTDGVESAIHILRPWPNITNTTTVTLPYTWTINSNICKPGQTILVRAIAVDHRKLRWRGTHLEPQSSASAWRAIHFVKPSQAASEQLARLEDLHARLWAILQTQISARLTASKIAEKTAISDILPLARDVRQRQVQIQTVSAELAASIAPQSGDAESDIKQVLTRLAHEEMLLAAQQADKIVGIKELDSVRQQMPSLIAVQDQVIDYLRKLLEATRRAMSESLAEMEGRPGGDLPDNVQDKLRDLAKKLREFSAQQRRIIEATKNLAKKPVEDFTEEEEQLLKELAAAEDEWARFMEESHSNLSKLPEQDFANPSLLEELVEIQTEIKMAAGALTKKTLDIAVPLEQLGAEMAEEMVTNIEKWLPDTPDRERWSQEEPLTDEMKEAPMAELPGELEDLVGELMEEEEALFDEMEDVSSSWADSIDAGAGWDAMDGPISNMSAKGVTGNRLPNTSEIGGRSGEGRQGKSSGEFVADTAVGKGGRKTPSRLTQDSFVKGQVKDLSKDPVGGATGGGKESGVGGEGLEGPARNQTQRELKRLATKQAELRNRAESIDLKFQVLNYHHTDLKKMMKMMAAVERDLRSGRYHSAIRHRDVMLDGLRGIKTYLGGEFEVRKDQSSNLPSDIQRELLGGMQEASPDGWEELNRKYFERLSGDE